MGERVKMADTMKWRLLIVCVLGLALKIEKVTSSKDILKKMTIGFSKVLEDCKNEVRINTATYRCYFLNMLKTRTKLL